MSRIVIATAQSKVTGNIASNGKEIRRLIRIGKTKGAKLVHFCEGALSGYAKNHLGEPENIDFAKIRIEINKIKELCGKIGIWVVFGSAHELSNDRRPHNSLYVISDKGELVNRYDKRKCSHSELKNWFTPGFEPCNFEIEGIKFGCILCIEIHFPELFLLEGMENTDCLLFSSFSKEPIFGIQAQGHAASNNYWISMSIPANESEFQPSQFISPGGEVLSKCRKNCSTLIFNEIDTEDDRWHIPLKLAKPWRRLARKGRIYETLRVDDERSKVKTKC